MDKSVNASPKYKDALFTFIFGRKEFALLNVKLTSTSDMSKLK